MNKNAAIWTVVGIIIVIIIIIAVSMMNGSSSNNTPAAPTSDQTTSISVGTPESTATTSTDASSTAPQTYTITYTDSGFTPNSLTIKQGDSVTYVNKSSNQMWVASDPHPTHQGYSGTTRSQHCPDTAGTAFDQCSTGNSYTFTFQKVGTWGYHNHAVDEDKGTIIVQ